MIEKMNYLKSKKLKSIAFSSLCVLLGLLFCFVPIKSLNLIETIVAIGLLAYGIICLFLYCFSSETFKDYRFLGSSIISVFIGLLMSFIPSFFVFIISMFLAFQGLNKLSNAIELKTLNEKHWWVDLAAGTVMFVFGVVSIILCGTNLSVKIIMIYFGVTLIINGVINLVLIFTIDKNLKKVKKFFIKDDNNFTDFEVD